MKTIMIISVLMFLAGCAMTDTQQTELNKFFQGFNKGMAESSQRIYQQPAYNDSAYQLQQINKTLQDQQFLEQQELYKQQQQDLINQIGGQ